MTTPRVVSQELGGSPLALSAQLGLASQWYPQRPRGGDSWRAYLLSVSERYKSGMWARALAPALEARGEAGARLERVVGNGGAVVSTGQQAALFGGPLYTLIKAISALCLAEHLEKETGIPVAPVFWAATDDADYEEARWAGFALTGGLEIVRLPDAEPSGVPMSRVPIRDLTPLLARLAEASGSAVDPRPLEIARETFASGNTLGSAYLHLLRHIFEPLGIAVLDASHPAVRESAAPVLRSALDRAADIEGALRARHDAIRSAGYVPQVEHIPDLTLVFAEEASGEKRRIQIREAATLDLEAASLGPNVLLRPIVERFLMPSACYVAGPGELAYFAQVGAVAETLGLVRPLAVPRWSATIVEPRVERLLDRLGVTREDLRDRAGLESRLAREAIPAAVSERLQSLRRDLVRDLGTLGDADRDKLVPTASLEGIRHWIEHRLDRLERRYAAGVKRRQLQLMLDVATAAAALYPNGKPQERVLNFIPFLARYGSPLVDAMRAAASEHAQSLIGTKALKSLVERV